MNWQDDTEFDEKTITKVEKEKGGYYAVTGDDGWTIGVKHAAIVPYVGDTLRCYGRGIGHVVRGIAINGQIVRYLTAEQQERRDKRHFEARQRAKKREGLAAIGQTCKRYAALPLFFRDRLDRTSEKNPDFWWDDSGYELFIYEQAVLCADNLGTPEPIDDLRDNAYISITSDQVKERYPWLDEAHSGHTFACMCGLAKLYLQGKEGE